MATFFSDSQNQSGAANAPREALLVFCRAPRLGQVKTRLARAFGEAFALQIYRAMLIDCFDLGRALAPRAETFACFTPTDAFDSNSELRALWDGAAFAQSGADLGARMLNALREAHARGFDRVVIIGSDAPDLPPQYLREAFDSLRENSLVVGPSEDGGFVLIGASCEVNAAIFAGITWSRDDVCARLENNLRALDFRYATLGTWRDVDEAADVEALRARLQTGTKATIAKATRAVLSRAKAG